MICFPNCKINLGLFVTAKRADGYHDLETVFLPVSDNTSVAEPYQSILHDVLEVVPAATTSQMHLSGLPVQGETNNNLVWKAYQLLNDTYPGKIPPVDIYLHKVIPMGAGLGGGSANGAWMLRLLNDMFSLQCTQEQLAAFALQLGSDCPFFIYNTPQFAAGRGEKMSPVALSLTNYEIRVICPGIHVSTRDAFSMIAPRPAPFDLRAIADLPVSEWKHHISNDFEQTVFPIHPHLAGLKNKLYDDGALYASMSGTGSAVYGIFNK
ncbi:MAG: 4-(cytidine 5'-diphospho)-2-C-methyl-D-erythritol kinase [Chitinophagaceae bacterium]|nr:4-(cytidine 5'-diphospho)-2-C-methyl-D-erythritol kinase [Chitinophagaceae bacterium]